jgi:hypothetical protein
LKETKGYSSNITNTLEQENFLYKITFLVLVLKSIQNFTLQKLPWAKKLAQCKRKCPKTNFLQIKENAEQIQLALIGYKTKLAIF